MDAQEQALASGAANYHGDMANRQAGEAPNFGAGLANSEELAEIARQEKLVREGIPTDIDPGDVISNLRAEIQRAQSQAKHFSERVVHLQKETGECMREIERLNKGLELAIREKNKAQDLGVDYKNKFLAECERYNDLVDKILEKMR